MFRVMHVAPTWLQELDRHEEALPALKDALHYLDADEPDSSVARLHYACAQAGCRKRVSTGTQAHRRTGAQAHRRTGAQAHRRTGAQAHRRTGAQAHRRTGAQAHRHTGGL
jgi:hypothetical protein